MVEGGEEGGRGWGESEVSTFVTSRLFLYNTILMKKGSSINGKFRPKGSNLFPLRYISY